jgi:feruloyl esterase
VAAGQFEPAPGAERLDVPAFCRVVAVATPTTDSTINFEVWLPAADAWNKKFQGVGNSGWSGAIPYASMAVALRRGYATAGTDTGHTGEDLSFAAGHPEKIIDWAYRGVHVMTIASKLIIRAHQGALPQHSYFTGCSTGGAQGLMSAQRYPEDYNGIVAGNPGNDRVGRLASYIWAWTAAHQTPESLIPPEKLQKVTDAVVSACDNLDGVKDGVIDDPRRCNFDPGTLLCKGEDTASCLTSRQLEALRKIYNGPHNARQVRQIFPGVPKGSESGSNAGWQTSIMDPPEPPGTGFWKHFVFADPNWDFRTFDWDRDLAYARARVGSIVDAANPDLRQFRERGGRLIMTAGWNDPINVSEQAIQYYEAVERLIDNEERTRDFFRLFMVPGMGHCAPGPGPSTFDAVAALEMWVQHQVPPDRIIATRPAADGAPARTRPLCPYPLVARQRAGGSIDEAATFTCVSPPRPK